MLLPLVLAASTVLGCPSAPRSTKLRVVIVTTSLGSPTVGPGNLGGQVPTNIHVEEVFRCEERFTDAATKWAQAHALSPRDTLRNGNPPALGLYYFVSEPEGIFLLRYSLRIVDDSIKEARFDVELTDRNGDGMEHDPDIGARFQLDDLYYSLTEALKCR